MYNPVDIYIGRLGKMEIKAREGRRLYVKYTRLYKSGKSDYYYKWVDLGHFIDWKKLSNAKLQV